MFEEEIKLMKQDIKLPTYSDNVFLSGSYRKGVLFFTSDICFARLASILRENEKNVLYQVLQVRDNDKINYNLCLKSIAEFFSSSFDIIYEDCKEFFMIKFTPKIDLSLGAAVRLYAHIFSIIRCIDVEFYDQQFGYTDKFGEINSIYSVVRMGLNFSAWGHAISTILHDNYKLYGDSLIDNYLRMLSLFYDKDFLGSDKFKKYANDKFSPSWVGQTKAIRDLFNAYCDYTGKDFDE